MADPYLAITFDTKRRIAQVARALDQAPGPAAWGLLELLEDVWRRKDPAVSAEVLAACFGPDPRIGPMLVSFGFLVAKGGAWELCAEEADRLLSTHRQRVAAGKARAAAAGRSGGVFTSGPPAADQRATSGGPAGAPAADQLLQPAASSQQPAAEDLAAGAAGPVEACPKCHGHGLQAGGCDSACLTCGGSGDARAKKPRQRAQAPARATNDAPELVLESQTPHEPDRGRQALIAALGERFLAIRGATYDYQGRDWKALDRLRAKHPDDEILRRWERGLQAKYKARCDSIANLEDRWNANAQPEASGATQAPRTADEMMGFPARPLTTIPVVVDATALEAARRAELVRAIRALPVERRWELVRTVRAKLHPGQSPHARKLARRFFLEAEMRAKMRELAGGSER